MTSEQESGLWGIRVSLRFLNHWLGRICWVVSNSALCCPIL